MKIRIGFVSNSSSSSFIIVSKNGKKLTNDSLLEAFDIKKSSPLYPFAKELSTEMLNSSDIMTAEKFKENFCGEDTKDEIFKDYNPIEFEIYKSAKENGWLIYYGLADSYEQPTLCELDLDFEDDKIKIVKEGGY